MKKRTARAVLAASLLSSIMVVAPAAAAEVAPIAGVATTPSGNGHWLVDSAGRVTTDGDAVSHGSVGRALNEPIVAIAPTPTGNGYWLAARDGGIFTFGDAPYRGSTGAMKLNQPIVGMAATPTGNGYWLAAGDGGIFTFGDARFAGAGEGRVTAVAGGSGYTLATAEGRVAAFGAGGKERSHVQRPTTPAPVGGGTSGGETTTTTTAPTTSSTTTPSIAPLPPVTALFHTAYDLQADGASPIPPWQAEQEPSVNGVPQDRITVVRGTSVPGRGQAKPTSALRTELRPFNGGAGDAWHTEYNRAEVYARHASPTTPPALWPDPVGSTRWYSWSVLIPEGFTFDSTGRNWISLAQWKGLRGGSPEAAIEIKANRLELAGAGPRSSLGAIVPGTWTKLVVGIHFSPDRSGWVEVWRDGVNVLPRNNRPTQAIDPGTGAVDPTYLKQGLYRTSAWTVTHVVHHGPMTITAARPPVD